MIVWRQQLYLYAACAGLSAWTAPGLARAQHPGDVLVQSEGGQLLTMNASPGPVTTISRWRTFHGEFDFSFSIDDPGFNSLAAGNPNLPAGISGLPPSGPLGWDFASMRIGDMAANLYYWNGAESDGVQGLSEADARFGSPPSASYRLYMQSFSYFVDGADAAVPGGVIAATSSSGTLHVHPYFSVNDGDQNGATEPADGVYLAAIRLRMPGLASSLPMYLLFGTPDSPFQALDNAAVPWVETHAETLVLLGDYNKNGVVEAADYTVWRNTFGQTGFGLAADGNWSEGIDVGDFHVWRDNYGKVSPMSASGSKNTWTIAAPEPASATQLLFWAACAVLGARRRMPCKITKN
jgi:hypothetical protein